MKLFTTLTVNGLRRVRPTKASYYSYAAEPTQPLNRQPIWTTAEDAVQCIKSCDTVFLSGGVSTPTSLISAMVEQGEKKCLKDIKVVHALTEGCAAYADINRSHIFRPCSLFVGSNLRNAIKTGTADTVPISSSDIPNLFSSGIIQPDVSLIHVSSPDEHGFCSLGTSVDCVRAAIINSKHIIAQVSPHMPRTMGDTLVHISHLDYAISVDESLPITDFCPMSQAECDIGRLIAEHLVEDGATLHFDVGNIPNAVMASLRTHKNLGIHTEVLTISEDFTKLIECGAVTNSLKKINTGKIVASTIVGNKCIFSLANNNPYIEMKTLDFTNCPFVISMLPKMTSINKAIEIDITGQVCSDSDEQNIHSGFGGQQDFMRGALKCTNGIGKPIIALTSLDSRGKSRIKICLSHGAGVVTSRADVNYVVTEYGIACLHGKSLRQRAYELIQISHPKYRCELERMAHDRLNVMPSL